MQLRRGRRDRRSVRGAATWMRRLALTLLVPVAVSCAGAPVGEGGAERAAPPAVPPEQSGATVTGDAGTPPAHDATGGSAPSSRGIPAAVVRVVDGDTIEARWDGRTRAVRLIGVDAPESVHPSRPVECYATAASRFTESSLEGAPVRLEFDVEGTDSYGRTLAYVWIGRRLFNLTLVARGFAHVATYPPNVKYVGRFVGAQRRARAEGRGLWGSCPAQGGDDVAGSAAGVRSSGRGCDPNYRGACVPPYPPDLDCGHVAGRGFRSVGSDPHGFDGDGDGVACEP